jgi:hypothetical protein
VGLPGVRHFLPAADAEPGVATGEARVATAAAKSDGDGTLLTTLELSSTGLVVAVAVE